MSFFLQRFAGALFYLLAGSFFLAYLLLRNDIGSVWPGWWMRIGDLPLALSALLYGGSSFYRTIHRGGGSSRPKFLIIAIVLTVVFIVLVLLNFWVVLGLPIAEQS